MNNVIKNHTRSLKEYLCKCGIKHITTIRHLTNFVFEAVTPYSYIKIITEPFDDEEKYIKIVSYNVNFEKLPLVPDEQELLLCLARLKNKKIYDFLNSEICQKIYSQQDIESFKAILDLNISDSSALQSYWDLDTASREDFMEIIHKVFCAILLG